jgi:hypothetical protein
VWNGCAKNRNKGVDNLDAELTQSYTEYCYMNGAKIISGLSVIFLVTGCATQKVEQGLSALVGQPIQQAFNTLGYPNGQQRFGNEDVYVWAHQSTGGMMLPQVATTYQNYGSQSMYGTVGQTPVYANLGPRNVTTSTLYNQYVPMNAQFMIKIGADSRSGIIRTWQWEGNELGAQFFAPRLGGLAAQARQRKAAPKKLSAEFANADTNGDGTLSRSEFSNFLTAFWVKKVDANGDGRVSRAEYLSGDRTEAGYNDIDRRGRGSVTATDAMRSARFRNLLEKEFTKADTNGDGVLSNSEFVKGY